LLTISFVIFVCASCSSLNLTLELDDENGFPPGPTKELAVVVVYARSKSLYHSLRDKSPQFPPPLRASNAA
jgi:hypothetical protein